jgi:hypothetical protein
MQLEAALSLVNTCADGMDEAQYNWDPQGTCNSVAKSHVHALTSADFFINGTIKGGPLLWQSMAASAGLPVNPMEVWAFSGTISLATMKDYAQHLQKAILDYVGTLNEGDLDRVLDTPFFGKKPVAFLLQLSGMHAAGHAGDMSAVKGMQGLKGLPF